MLNLSLDEVLEFVSLGYLPPSAGAEAREYRFRMREIRLFAERFLGFQEADFDSAMRRMERARPKRAADPPPPAAETVDATQLTQGGVIDFTAHRQHVQEVAEQKDALFGQYARYREQVGYRIGQLETLLQQEQHERSASEDQQRQQAEKLELLKKKLLEARSALEALEAERKSSIPWWHRLLGRG